MRNDYYRASWGSTGRHHAPNQQLQAQPENAAGREDDRSVWGRPPAERLAGAASPITSQSDAVRRFQRALAIGNPRLVRAAAAELPDISLAQAAAILLVIERTEPENYEHTALRWLARLATEAAHADLNGVAQAATALQALPHAPAARATLAAICTTAGLADAATAFASDHRSPMPPPDY